MSTFTPTGIVYRKGEVPLEVARASRAAYKEARPKSFGPNCYCPGCGADTDQQERRNYDIMWGDADIYCCKCGSFVRTWDRD